MQLVLLKVVFLFDMLPKKKKNTLMSDINIYTAFFSILLCLIFVPKLI